MLIIGLRGLGFNFPGSLTTGFGKDFVVAVGFYLLLFIVLVATVSFLFVKVPVFFRFTSKFDPLERLRITLDKGDRSIFVCWLAIFVCWIPWIILVYPADMNGDTINQLFQYSTDAPTWYTTLGISLENEYIDHHPMLDTLVFGLFLDLGTFLGSHNGGIFIYIILQAILLSGALALTCCYLSKLNVAKSIRIGLVLFVALFPPFAQFASTMPKDSLFCIFFLLFFICTVETFRTKGEAIKNR